MSHNLVSTNLHSNNKNKHLSSFSFFKTTHTHIASTYICVLFFLQLKFVNSHTHSHKQTTEEAEEEITTKVYCAHKVSLEFVLSSLSFPLSFTLSACSYRSLFTNAHFNLCLLFNFSIYPNHTQAQSIINLLDTQLS